MKTFSILTLLLTSFTVIADPTIERYGVLPKIQQMTISPNGEKIAYRSVDLQTDTVTVLSVNPGKKIATIDVSKVKPRDLKFIDNDNLLLNVAADTNIPGFRGDFELSTSMVYNIESSKYNQLLIPGKDEVYAGQASLNRIIGISPDGKSVYMPAFSGEPIYTMGQQITPPMSLFRTRIDGSGRARIHMQGRGDATDYFVGTDGEVIAREAFDEKENKHQLFVFRGNKSFEIFSEKTPYPTKQFIGLSLDEQDILILDANKSTNSSAIYTLSLADGNIKGPLYNKDNADIVRYISDRQRKIIGVEYSGFNPSYTFFDSELDNRVQAILAKFPQHSVWIEEISPDGNHILVKVEGTQAAGDYYLYSKGKETVFITTSRPEIPVDEIHPLTTITFKASDGFRIPTLLTIPRDRIETLNNLPAVVLPHGGPESFDPIGFDYLAQALAHQGYLVIQPQFRGSRGFGSKHQAAGYGEWGRKALQDLTDAVDFLTKQKVIDRNKVCIVGASYGGYSALAGGAFAPDVYKCVVSINGIGNLEDMLNRTSNESGSNSAALAFWQAQILGFEETNMEIAKQRSPELVAQNFKAPVLLIHSENDESVHPRQSITMYRALKDAGKNVQKIELSGEDHYLSHGPTRLQALKATIDFVNKNI